MSDSTANARAVFGVFQKHFASVTSPTARWSLRFEKDGEELALTKSEIAAAVGVLMHKELIRMQGIGSYCLDKAGTEACLHPELLDEYLAPRRAAAPVQNITINADNMQNTQIGHNNTLNVSYSTALTELREQVQRSALPVETKSGWTKTIDDMLHHPLMPTIVTATAAAIALANKH